MKKSVKPQLPAGFKAITGGGGDSWKPTKKGESILGTMAGVKSVHFEKEGKRAARDVNIYTVKTKEGDLNVWESAGLRALAKIKKGKAVFIQYLGDRVMKKGQSAMHEYVVATK